MAEPPASGVLVVHGDPDLRARITATLAARGHAVQATSPGAHPVGQPTVIVTDHRAIPRPTSARILALVPQPDEASILAAFAAGADDVLAGPPRSAELASRVAVLARSAAGRPRLQVGPIEIDPITRGVTICGRPLELTRREYDLLSRLAAAPGRVVTKQELLHEIWGQPTGGSGRRLDAQVARLRRRLGDHRALLVTVWGVGYRLGG